jgi:ElaB/YqjD/DUF883 family membrane-anchored ribosome-binding protein
MSETIQRYRFPTTPAMNGYEMEASAEGKWVRYEDHAAEVARLTGELEELVDAGARAAEEGFKIAARLTARVEEAEARAARAARELAEARGRENHALARLDAARTEAARLREALEELVAAMDRYEADACEEPPQRHRDMMTRARRALGGEADASVAQ